MIFALSEICIILPPPSLIILPQTHKQYKYEKFILLFFYVFAWRAGILHHRNPVAWQNALQHVPCRRNYSDVSGIHSKGNEKGTSFGEVPFRYCVYHCC